MSKIVSAGQAESQFASLMRDVRDFGETVFVEQSGETQVVLLSVDEFKRMGGQTEGAQDWLVRVERARKNIAKELNGRTLPDVSETIRQMREERDAQIDDALRGRQFGDTPAS